MQLIDQVVPLATAIRLKELGVKQVSLFYHVPGHDEPIYRADLHDFAGIVSAFTVAELGVMLPGYTETWYDSDDEIWCCRINGAIHPMKGETMAVAMATELLSAINMGSLPITEINERLSR